MENFECGGIVCPYTCSEKDSAGNCMLSFCKKFYPDMGVAFHWTNMAYPEVNFQEFIDKIRENMENES